MSSTPTFVDWEGRPAIIVGSSAWVVPRRSDAWEAARAEEVAESGAVLAPEVFAESFPNLPPALPEMKSSSTVPLYFGQQSEGLLTEEQWLRARDDGIRYAEMGALLNAAQLAKKIEENRQKTESVSAANSETETEELGKKLIQYPGVSHETVERQIESYAERRRAKAELMYQRGMSNRMAEIFLDRQGWLRPPGWHSVFFYPDSNVPRTGYIVLAAVIVALIWFF